MSPIPTPPLHIQAAYLDLCTAFQCLLNREPGIGAGPADTGRAARCVLDAIAALIEEYPQLRATTRIITTQ